MMEKIVLMNSLKGNGLRIDGSAAVSDNSRKIELDFVRGIAILLVLGAHYVQPSTGVALIDWFAVTTKAVGGVGVDLFFALSGFLVGGLLLKEYKTTGTLNAKRFLVRRALKILPALYVLVLFHAIVGRHPIDTFFWQNIFQVQNYFGTSIAQTWSLGVEEHFYLLLVGLLVLCIGRSSRFIFWVLLGVCVTSTLVRIIAVQHGYIDAAFRQTQFRIDGLMYGVLLALVFHFYPKVFAKFAHQREVLIVISACLCLWIYYTAENFPLVRSIGFSIQGLGFIAFLTLVYTHSGRQVSRLWYRSVAWLGVYSYGIYLWHTLALAPGAKAITIMQSASLNPLLTWVIALTVQLAIGIAVGVIMTKVVELPMLRVREKLFPPTAALNKSV
jgi:peptidoglycan/LPS O-acetylase OafA/YrhL